MGHTRLQSEQLTFGLRGPSLDANGSHSRDDFEYTWNHLGFVFLAATPGGIGFVDVASALRPGQLGLVGGALEGLSDVLTGVGGLVVGALARGLRCGVHAPGHVLHFPACMNTKKLR